MPSFSLIHFLRWFFELNLLEIEGINDPNYLEKEPWNFIVFRDEKCRRKFENTYL